MSINVGTAVASIVLDRGNFDSGIRRVGQDLNGIGGHLANAGSKVKSFGDSMSNVGSTMTEKISLPIVGVGAAIAKTSIEVGNAQSKLQAQLGTTAEKAEELTKKAKNVWAEGFGENISEVTETLKEVKMNLGDISDKELEKVTKGAMTLSSVFEADVGESTRAAGVMMKNFGINSQKAFDLMTVGFQKGGDYSGELLDTMREYSPQFKAMGYSAEEMLQVLISGAQSGAWNLDKVGDAIKEFNIRSKDGSKGTAEAFEALGLDAADLSAKFASGGEQAQQAMGVVSAALVGVKDPLERNQIGVQLFGTQFEDLEDTVIKSMLTTKTELGEVAGATEKASNTMKQSLGQQFKSILRELFVALEPIGQVMLDVIKAVLPALKTLISAFSALPAPVKKGIAGIVLSVALLGPAINIFGKFTSTIGGLLGAFSKLGKVGSVVGKLVSTFGSLKKVPAIIGSIVSSFGGLTKIGGIASKLLSPIKGVIGIFGKLKSAAGIFSLLPGIVSPPVLIVTAIIAGIAAISLLVIKNWDKVKAAAKSVVGGIKKAFGGLKAFFEMVVEGWKIIFKGVINFFKKIPGWIVDGLLGGLKKLGGKISDGAKSLASKITSPFKKVLGINSPSKVFNEYGMNIGQGLTSGLDKQEGLIRNKIKGIANSIKDIGNVAPNFDALKDVSITGPEYRNTHAALGNSNSKLLNFTPNITMHLTLTDLDEKGAKELSSEVKSMTQSALKNAMAELFMDDAVRG